MAQFPLIDQASLVMIPGAYKEGKIYSQLPTDGSGDFTFTRGTDTATRVNENGLIEKERVNLLLQSNTFDTIWAVGFNTSVTNGQSGYDGTNDAWLLSKSASNAYMFQDISASGVQTFSVYAKAGTSSWLRLVANTSNFQGGYFDLSNGVTGGVENAIDTKIENVGNGWYRCSVIFNGSTTRVRVYPAEANSTAATTGSIYIQDAQVQQGLVATDYIETTTVPVYAGLTDNMPRLDYSGGASCPALLLEPQRTNKITNSEYINTTTFNQNTGLTINNNEATSPSGLNNAAKIIATTANSRHELRTSLATASGYDMVSCFVKASGYNYVQIASWANPATYVNFDLTDGSVGSVGSTPPTNYGIEDYGNGWYRIYANVQASGGGIIGIGIVTSASAGWAQSFTGNGTDGLLIWGVQIEEGSYPTSYIPTYGSTQTRAADDLPFPSSFEFGTLGDGESGTMVVKTIVNSLTDNNRFNFFSNGGSANWYWNGTTLYSQTTGGSRQFNLGSTASSNLGTEVKLCMRKSGNTLSCFFNGDEKGSIDIGSESIRYVNDFSTYLVSQSVVEFEEFPTALTDSECIALTTL